MYLPPHFAEERPEALHHLIAHNPLGALVVMGPDGLDANHIPFELNAETGPNGTLHAHVARANPVWQQMCNGDPVLVIFRAEDGYISPNWYPSKHETHRQVPTWNYRVVHVHGHIQIRDDEKYVRGLVGRLTREHERRTGDAKPWTMADSDPAYITSMIQSIVGVEITITRLAAKCKLSQNKEARDRQGAVDALHAHRNHALAEAIATTLEPR
ncbi:FMN-binding negative transcriptional regulator [Candidatus Aalborgicola defluviihabitans]|jgi:transcriptional regulator|uniref:FMN-binding negative transcriptional regulator n=1 Tax=Candidatus Aalborgicola defluviihabitans TaxID=3386187 RepID=UPI001E16AA21|nr:FMN-binding negative transcriptional regulator [Burkholderiales bacterium]MBK7314966.1 FMN-binding negative transcriptional regulator [Burkholderiales bacterium]MBL0242601.1 FMN-binding negative transcriptional regulator [Rhodoferax sp.]